MTVATQTFKHTSMDESGYSSCSSDEGKNSSSLCSTPPGSPDPTSLRADCNSSEINCKRQRVSDDEDRKLRLQERKRRNRESAERSRQRKLLYYKKLEEDNAILRAENQALRSGKPVPVPTDLSRENQTLKAQVAQLQKELEELKKNTNIPSTCPPLTVEPVLPLEQGSLDDEEPFSLNNLLDDLMVMNAIKQEPQDIVDDLFEASIFEDAADSFGSPGTAAGVH